MFVYAHPCGGRAQARLKLCSKIGAQINFALINVRLWRCPLKWIIRATHQYMSLPFNSAHLYKTVETSAPRTYLGVSTCVDSVIKLYGCCM